MLHCIMGYSTFFWTVALNVLWLRSVAFDEVVLTLKMKFIQILWKDSSSIRAVHLLPCFSPGTHPAFHSSYSYKLSWDWSACSMDTIIIIIIITRLVSTMLSSSFIECVCARVILWPTAQMWRACNSLLLFHQSCMEQRTGRASIWAPYPVFPLDTQVVFLWVLHHVSVCFLLISVLFVVRGLLCCCCMCWMGFLFTLQTIIFFFVWFCLKRHTCASEAN